MATGFMGYKNSSPKLFNNNYKNNNNNNNNNNYKKRTNFNFKREFSTSNMNKGDLNMSKLLKDKDMSKPEDMFNEMVSKNYYMGSGHTNNLYSRFHNHLLTDNRKGSKLVQRSVKKYGMNNFIYGMLEYYPYDVNIHNNEELFALETSYISLLSPAYNMMTEAGQFFGLKNKEININNKSNLMNLSLLNDRKELLKKIKDIHLNEYKKSMKKRTDFTLSEMGKNNMIKGKSKFIYISNNMITEDDIINKNYLCSFTNMNTASHYLCCSSKTIQRSLNMGVIYLPDLFQDYLNNNHIDSHNSMIEYMDKSKMDLYNYKKSIRMLKI
ncbi:hypothetical protein DAMA08_021000 (mitochondrion) [Martiniozyma asiatica (nom. inval.)]|nr:hypothetical protein DAMA08_021000 [Martiniozyma asiatica]